MAPPWVRGVLLDLLMAVMDSPQVWAVAAGERTLGLTWRDAVTARMIVQPRYDPYEDLVRAEAVRLALGAGAADGLFRSWRQMQPWPEASVVADLRVPYGFVTNCSRPLAGLAADRSGLRPSFVVSAEEIGWYKPHPEAYRAACRRLGTAAEDTLFVAGSPYDAEGAHAAGLQTRLVRRRSDQAAPPKPIQSVPSLIEVVTALAGARGSDPV